jgi:hypothetical protein
VVDIEGLKILLVLESKWTVCLNDVEFLALNSADIHVQDSQVVFGPYVRTITGLEWLRPNVVRIRARTKFRSKIDTITLYPGDHLPSTADLRRRRRSFQMQISKALSGYFGVRTIERSILHSDRRRGIGGAYPRFFIGKYAVITVDPDESSSVINGMMRAALLWRRFVRRPIVAVVPSGRHQAISTRLRVMKEARQVIQWLQWDGNAISPMSELVLEADTCVQRFALPELEEEVARICAMAPDLLQAVPHIAAQATSIRIRGIEVARVSKEGTTYPLGEPLIPIIEQIDQLRRYDSRHPLARAHEERWLESNLIREIHQVLPSIDARYIYPQVPSFVGQERNIIDLLTITNAGRLVVIEIKASADPDLPFQALDYWIAVERHRVAGDFPGNGYFPGCVLRDQPAMLVLVAPLLAYHKTSHFLTGWLPRGLPLLEIGLNQTWKKGIKVLRRRGMVS